MKLTKEQLQKNQELQKDVSQNWPLRKGKNELLAHLSGQELGRKDAMVAYCYECSGGYEDGPYDCGVSTCALYPFHPYRDGRSRREVNPEVLERMQKGLAEWKKKQQQ